VVSPGFSDDSNAASGIRRKKLEVIAVLIAAIQLFPDELRVSQVLQDDLLIEV
jgi:hypothetical protein